MSKHIAKLSRDPFCVTLTDRPISMFVDPSSGAIFIDEGAGDDRMNGAAIPALKEPRFLDVASDSGSLLKVQCGTFTWEVGTTGDAEAAASWVEAVNAFLATKRDFESGRNGTRALDPSPASSRTAVDQAV